MGGHSRGAFAWVAQAVGSYGPSGSVCSEHPGEQFVQGAASSFGDRRTRAPASPGFMPVSSAPHDTAGAEVDIP